MVDLDTTAPVPALVVEDLGAADWSQQMQGNYPLPWTDQTGPNFQAVMTAFGQNPEVINQMLKLAWQASRIATAVGQQLDYVSEDFFGNGLPRNPGEPDDSFRARIQNQIFLPRVTRTAIQNILESLTGAPVTMLEPWYLPDTASWDGQSYWDIDDPRARFRWGSPELIYQGFVECQLPPFSVNNGIPLWCWDVGLAWDAPSFYWLPMENTWFTQSKDLDAAIIAAKAMGTTIYRKYSVPIPNFTIGSTVILAEGTTGFGIQSLDIQGPIVVIAQASWFAKTAVVVMQPNGYNLSFDNPVPPGGGSVDYLIMPITLPGTNYIPITSVAPTITVGIPSGPWATAIPAPSWNTNVIDTDAGGSDEVFEFSNEPQIGDAFGCIFFNSMFSGDQNVSAGTTAVTINISAVPGLRNPFGFFCKADWNTTLAVLNKTLTTVTVGFTNPPPSGGGNIDWAVSLF